MKSAARSAIRVLAILATVWFGSTSAIAAYAYDAPHCANTINHAAYECGRPTNHTAATTPEAVHQWSHGAMACHDTAPTRNYSTYKLPASLAQDDGLAGSVRGLAEMVRAETSSLLVGPVAANAGPKALNASTRVAPWAGSSLSRLSREGEVMYRVYGGGAGKAGSWLTPINPVSSAATRQGLALPAENAALYVSKVTLPGGVRMQVGTAGSAFGQPGGWAQAQLLERIPLSSFGKGVPLQ